MKTIVIINNDDQQHGDFKKGQKGYIDGYIRGGTDTPFAVVVIGKDIVMVPLHCLQANGLFHTPTESQNNNG